MNFQDLLNEVEDAMKSPRSGGGGTGGHTVGVKYANDEESFPIIALPSSKGRGKNDLDDLLDMLGDEDSKPTAVHPRPKSSSRAGAYNSPDSKISRTECPQVLLDGGHASRGLSTAFSSRHAYSFSSCSNLRCNECDFTVVQFPGKKWDASVDYMFFRENVPSEAKLRVKMEIAPDFTAYACQCKWLSICSQTRMDNCQVKWSCAGH
ncbi:sporangia induced hypothetical protein [Phytophthora infestans T30-4]|uniref:Cilia- and flagella-associated protein 418 n=1 Tax=Phytophthora infestans (strain T30-4) TaxID=403677 RepID=D0N9B8_PHYIT|nr:sporangia induced hypothetical protein [Phytophthora infestans T30-4]EEY54406.1 sporangia induced hypothetical protein [Phytophthora infestans T30-4]|eukprot:XP_002904228.1 sporangia induced hypothetical protein [Phytophthora infestans T30-4]